MSDANEVEIGNQASSVRFQDDIGQIKNSEGEAVLEVNNDQQIFLAKSSPQVYIDKFIDDDTMATASATSLSTSESIKAYVDATGNGERVVIEAKNDSGADMSKGDVVYVSGESLSGKPLIDLADADASGKCPAIGVLPENILNGAEGNVAVSGYLSGLDTSSWAAGDALYVSTTPGQLTNTRPAGTAEKVQNIGFVTRDHATVGSIAVVGSGRSNDVPNSLTALTGVALDASDLGTFTGSIISDNTDIKTALQELETSSSGGGLTVTAVATGDSPVTGAVDIVYIVDTSSGNVEIDLPAASGNSGKTIDVLHKTTGNDCIIDPSGSETINGDSASVTMNGVAYQNITLICDGTEWYIR